MTSQLKQKINSCSRKTDLLYESMVNIDVLSYASWMSSERVKYKTEKARVAEDGHEFRKEMRASSISEKYRVEIRSTHSISWIKLAII